ncbi:MAG: Holliday junction branch migration protein RuvA [Candidatus Melainabacteria bacterium]
MLSHLCGQLVARTEHGPQGATLVVDVQGIGFEVMTSLRTVQAGSLLNAPIQLFTTLIVREDAMTLVGFLTREERDLFRILQSASGVGARMALSLLSSLSVADIAQAIMGGHHKVLTTAKGVGPKLAQKMTVDLKEKMTAWRQQAISQGLNLDSADNPEWNGSERAMLAEAEAVLMSLGYQPAELARCFTRQASEKPQWQSAEDVLRDSLKWLAQQT